jgi:hypothetical protein
MKRLFSAFIYNSYSMCLVKKYQDIHRPYNDDYKRVLMGYIVSRDSLNFGYRQLWKH